MTIIFSSELMQLNFKPKEPKTLDQRKELAASIYGAEKIYAYTENVFKGDVSESFFVPTLLKEEAKRLGFDLPSEISIKKQRGFCSGASLHFLEKWENESKAHPELNSFKRMSVIAENFFEGVPFQAVLYQTIMESLKDRMENQGLDKVGFFLLNRILEKNYSHKDIDIEEIKNVLTFAKSYDFLCHNEPFCEAFFKKYPEQRSPSFYALLRHVGFEVEQTVAPLASNDDQTRFDAFNAVSILTSLEIRKTSICSATVTEAYNGISQLAEGAYLINFPVHNSIGVPSEMHSLGFVKDKDVSFIYDSNFSVCRLNGKKEPEEAVSRAFNYYCGESGLENWTTNERCQLYLKAIFSQKHHISLKPLRGVSVFQVKQKNQYF